MSFTFLRGLVIDVIDGLSDLTLKRKSISDYASKVNIENLRSFPRNTLIVKQLTQGSAKLNDVEIICYPFFSSHLSLPIKTGEQVWFAYEDPDNRGPIAYWMSRVHDPSHVEDLNFSFFTKSYRNKTEEDKSSSSKFDKSNGKKDDPVDDLNALISPTSYKNEMIDIVQFTKELHKFEPVPSYTKRMGDFVLQGSNNTLIMLGEERGHSSKSASAIVTSANKTSQNDRSAAIDIVVGRGNSTSTSCESIEGPLGTKISNKKKRKITEGDAHFRFDSARLYLTANSNKYASHNPDVLLSITNPNYKNLPGINFIPKEGSFAVVKADNLRLVSRSQGIIKIIKEPDDGKINGSALVFHEDGTAQLNGSRINLSTYHSEEALQPYVLHDGLVTLLTQVLTEITAFATAAAALIPNTLPASLPATIAKLQARQAGINSTTIFGE